MVLKVKDPDGKAEAVGKLEAGMVVEQSHETQSSYLEP